MENQLWREVAKLFVKSAKYTSLASSMVVYVYLQRFGGSKNKAKLISITLYCELRISVFRCIFQPKKPIIVLHKSLNGHFMVKYK